MMNSMMKNAFGGGGDPFANDPFFLEPFGGGGIDKMIDKMHKNMKMQMGSEPSMLGGGNGRFA